MTNFKSLLLVPAFAAGLLATGCASTGPYYPIVDEAPSARLDANLAQCQAIAANYNSGDGIVEEAVVSNALTGGLVGGLQGSYDGDTLDGVLIGAAIGGLFGLIDGNSQKSNADNHARRDITRNCLASRGHRVIG